MSAHPAPDDSTVTLSVKQSLQIDAQVISSVFNTQDQSYHYNLQCTMEDGNNSATVQVNDVVEQLVTGKWD